MTFIDQATIRKLSPALLSVARRALPRADAEDVVQETWMSALRSQERFEARSSVLTWLMTILRRRICDHLRRRPPTVFLDEPMVAEDGAPDEWASAHEMAAVAAAALESLTALERAAIVGCELPGGRADLCERLGITNAHLRVLLYRAHRKLLRLSQGSLPSAG